MKRSVFVLTGTTLALALACAYLVNQVQIARAHAHAEAALRGQWEARFKDLERARSLSESAGTIPGPSAGAGHDSTAGVHTAPKPPAKLSRDERFLAQLANPAGHAQLLAETMLSYPGRRRPDLAKRLHLTSEEENQLVTLEAEQMLNDQAVRTRCRLEPGCHPESLSYPVDRESDKRQLRDLLGPEKFDEYEAYLETVGERMQVRELRARLDASSALSDDRAETLIAAIHDEGKRYASETEQAGQGISSFGFSIGGQLLAAQPFGEPQSDAQTVSAAQEFARRIRERAAGLLTAEQLRQFAAIQDEQLKQMRLMLRSQHDTPTSSESEGSSTR
jgi:hypothetical protein